MRTIHFVTRRAPLVVLAMVATALVSNALAEDLDEVSCGSRFITVSPIKGLHEHKWFGTLTFEKANILGAFKHRFEDDAATILLKEPLKRGTRPEIRVTMEAYERVLDCMK